MKRLFAITFVLSTSAIACGPDYGRTDIRSSRLAPGAEVSPSRIVVAEGTLVSAHIEALNDDDKTMKTRVDSKNSGVVEIVELTTEHEYAFFGIRAGQTQVEVRADDDVVLVIDATVTAQPGR